MLAGCASFTNGDLSSNARFRLVERLATQKMSTPRRTQNSVHRGRISRCQGSRDEARAPFRSQARIRLVRSGMVGASTADPVGAEQGRIHFVRFSPRHLAARSPSECLSQMSDIGMPLFDEIKVMSPEEIAFDLGYISADQFLAAGALNYVAFLKRRAAEGRNPPQPFQ